MEKALLFLIIPLICYSQSKNIFPDTVVPVKIFSEGYFTEGPAQGLDDCVYFSDLTFTEETGMQAGIIWKYNPEKDTTVVYRSPSGMANGIAFDPDGNMIICEGADFGGRRITITDLKTGKSRIVTAMFSEKPYNSPNDLVIDKNGRIYFTDPRYVGYENIDQPVMGVYRVDTNGYGKLIIENIPMPNGIAISPDQKTLYVGCNFEGNENNKPVMRIYKYTLCENGEVKSPEIFIDFPETSGPDGMTVDNEGNLYVAVRDEINPAIKVFNDKGKEIDSIFLPEVPSNLTFGRDSDSNILFITAGGSLYKINTTVRGFHRD
ncbi:MAG: SMP-30/gluconolactonase/LRE family protein [bacterium]|nr:SMP-30/gluconolactonase/LRE family protein [bacterium]